MVSRAAAVEGARVPVCEGLNSGGGGRASFGGGVHAVRRAALLVSVLISALYATRLACEWIAL